MSQLIPDSSPYSPVNGGFIEQINGQAYLQRTTTNVPEGIKDTQHTVVQIDTCTRLAIDYYTNKIQDPQRYGFVIADANPRIENPGDLSDLAGQQIRIPNITALLT